MNGYNRSQEGQALSKKGFWLIAAVCVSLGALLTILIPLPGCGSDSNPVKSDKPVVHKGHGLQTTVPLVLGNQGQRELGKSAIKKEPLTMEPPSITREEMAAKNAEAVKIAESPGMEIFPGATREEMARRNAEAVKIAESPGMEIFPGATREEMARRNAEALNSAPPWFVERMAQESKQAAAQPPARPYFPPAEK